MENKTPIKDTPEAQGNPRKEVIIVTGSSGMIGSVLIHKMAANYRLAGLDLAGHPYPPAEAECICVDLRNKRV